MRKHPCITRPRPPTVTGNSPIFSSPSLLPRFFPSWTAQRMSCSCVSGPPRMKSSFSVIIFCHRSRTHHIYDDTAFCHNYRHRSVISMTEKLSFGPKCHGCVFFYSVSYLPRPLSQHHSPRLHDDSKGISSKIKQQWRQSIPLHEPFILFLNMAQSYHSLSPLHVPLL